MSLHAAAHEVEFRDDAKLALAIDEDFAVALERRDAGVEQVLLPTADREARRDLGRRERHAGVGQFTQDGRAGRPCFGVAGSRLALASAIGSRSGGRTPAQGDRF